MDGTQSGHRISLTQKTGLILGPVLFSIVLLFFDVDPEKPALARMAAVAVLMAVWWITEAIPLFATSLLPMILYPLMGILESNATAPLYFNSTILLFIGGFMIALTMEKWNLHKRIALFIIKYIGGGPSRMVLGFMLSAAFLSMWISNTATAIMMIPIGLAIILKMEENFSIAATKQFSTCLMLAIAYGCSLGGIATLVGTPPNLSFARIFQILFPQAEPVAFGTWFIMALPISAVLLVVVWLMLTRIFFRFPSTLKIDSAIVRKEYNELGTMGFEEKALLFIFALTAVLWVFRNQLNLGFVTIPGWSQLLPYPAKVDDATVALLMAGIMFLIPTRRNNTPYPTLMGPDVIKKLPWHIVLLFGGGFALAKGIKVTGLSEFIGAKFNGFDEMPPFLMIITICFVLTFLTEVTSNTATTEMILPILGSVAVAMQTNPLLLMIPATLSASCAFMLPVATPPNAIVFGSGRIRISEMARAGIFINLISIIIITVLFYFLGTVVFSIDPGGFPEWAYH